ncbi:cation-dependent mannose-6-phosphate receptor [Odontesthes bonariensis]|uniref:cation-dependent mannose-6-phosphate receptor n=1 Tax=Odontesthes bonariensis TaxID=219752 RepID=UPI003F58ABF8
MKVFSLPRRGSILVWTMAIQLALCGSVVFATDGTKACKLLSESVSERNVLNKLEPLAHKNFTVDATIGEDSYTYVFQLCGDAGGVPGAGVIQVDKKSPKKITVIGQYNSTKAIGGSDWVMLIYNDGDTYDAHCSKEKRKAIVMISCSTSTDMGQLEVVMEDRERTSECFYLFELDSKSVCPTIQSHLSAGSIILIIGFCLVAVYLIGGFLYQRLIVGAKGMEQFPNYAFWVEVGNLTADGCDFVCRSQNREKAPAYRGLTTDALEEEPEERDDHLLPM